MPFSLTIQLKQCIHIFNYIITLYSELILVQSYTSAIDIWSVGCIFAELLGMQKANVPNFKDRNPLFPGDKYGELSDDGKGNNRNRRNSQLNVIFDVLGTPGERELELLDETTRQEIRMIGTKHGKNLRTCFPGSQSEEIDLLEKMLKFTCSERITIDDALAHPFFAGIRKVELEIEAPDPLSNDIENIEEDDKHLYDSVIGDLLHFEMKRREKEL